MASARRSAPRFRVSDWVSLIGSPEHVLAQIVEDRGPIGVGGRRLYAVRLDQGGDEPTVFELPEEDLAAVEMPPREK